jgi:hypothetical protein
LQVLFVFVVVGYISSFLASKKRDSDMEIFGTRDGEILDDLEKRKKKRVKSKRVKE